MKSYTRPEPRPLELKLKDILEDEVEERYYLTDEQVASFRASTAKQQAKGNGFKFEPIERERERGTVAHTIATRAGSRQTDNFIKESSAESKQSKAMTKSSEYMGKMDALQPSAQCKAAIASRKSSHQEGGER